MTTLLVTGAAGFIGSNFTRYWRSTYPTDTVVALDALTYAGVREGLADIADEITFVHDHLTYDLGGSARRTTSAAARKPTSPPSPTSSLPSWTCPPR